ncbi:diacylglycerol kinase family protein [Planococcus sp. CP5-4]|uniref:diacylglycerol kinase family protein n=1 Tax=unclassified Planococcus (in: firmicutes) TaxID=2662419 RepID=UPI001C2374DC|nr:MULTISPECIES: diacylglycerol kinase family protein [unclassified Planococcus (in: firmicutes)]MBU9672813.1 diacylglycerol kinase family protein [Planococcus sp. CP5-4_YE]MBV0908585.1 diacylglycerol kinase family protein [Planococcus sp. CP5-4_UN]MBW6063354.1 diacylglycerol kinase family protein [Planococcus sp. CP5-4]
MKLSKFLSSFRFAAQGIGASIKQEQNMRVHAFSAVIVLIAGIWAGLEPIEWMLVIMLIGGMLALELVNSALERTVDLVTKECHPLAKQAKDMAAGAVLVFAVTSAIIGLLIFLPKWF